MIGSSIHKNGDAGQNEPMRKWMHIIQRSST